MAYKQGTLVAPAVTNKTSVPVKIASVVAAQLEEYRKFLSDKSGEAQTVDYIVESCVRYVLERDHEFQKAQQQNAGAVVTSITKRNRKKGGQVQAEAVSA